MAGASSRGGGVLRLNLHRPIGLRGRSSEPLTNCSPTVRYSESTPRSVKTTTTATTVSPRERCRLTGAWAEVPSVTTSPTMPTSSHTGWARGRRALVDRSPQQRQGARPQPRPGRHAERALPVRPRRTMAQIPAGDQRLERAASQKRPPDHGARAAQRARQPVKAPDLSPLLRRQRATRARRRLDCGCRRLHGRGSSSKSTSSGWRSVNLVRSWLGGALLPHGYR